MKPRLGHFFGRFLARLNQESRGNVKPRLGVFKEVACWLDFARDPGPSCGQVLIAIFVFDIFKHIDRQGLGCGVCFLGFGGLQDERFCKAAFA